MSIIKLQIIDFDGRHKFTLSFRSTQPRNLLRYKSSEKPTKNPNKQYDIKEKDKVFRQKELTKWIYS